MTDQEKESLADTHDKPNEEGCSFNRKSLVDTYFYGTNDDDDDDDDDDGDDDSSFAFSENEDDDATYETYESGIDTVGRNDPCSVVPSFDSPLEGLYNDMGFVVDKAVDTLGASRCMDTTTEHRGTKAPGKNDFSNGTTEETVKESVLKESSSRFLNNLRTLTFNGGSPKCGACYDTEVNQEPQNLQDTLDEKLAKKSMFVRFKQAAQNDLTGHLLKKDSEDTTHNDEIETLGDGSVVVIPEPSGDEYSQNKEKPDWMHENTMDKEKSPNDAAKHFKLMRIPKAIEDGFLLRTRSDPEPSGSASSMVHVARTRSFDGVNLQKLAVALNRRKRQTLRFAGDQRSDKTTFVRIDTNKNWSATLTDIVDEATCTCKDDHTSISSRDKESPLPTNIENVASRESPIEPEGISFLKEEATVDSGEDQCSTSSSAVRKRVTFEDKTCKDVGDGTCHEVLVIQPFKVQNDETPTSILEVNVPPPPQTSIIQSQSQRRLKSILKKVHSPLSGESNFEKKSTSIKKAKTKVMDSLYQLKKLTKRRETQHYEQEIVFEGYEVPEILHLETIDKDCCDFKKATTITASANFVEVCTEENGITKDELGDSINELETAVEAEDISSDARKGSSSLGAIAKANELSSLDSIFPEEEGTEVSDSFLPRGNEHSSNKISQQPTAESTTTESSSSVPLRKHGSLTRLGSSSTAPILVETAKQSNSIQDPASQPIVSYDKGKNWRKNIRQNATKLFKGGKIFTIKAQHGDVRWNNTKLGEKKDEARESPEEETHTSDESSATPRSKANLSTEDDEIVKDQIAKKTSQGWQQVDIMCPHCHMPILIHFEKERIVCVFCESRKRPIKITDSKVSLLTSTFSSSTKIESEVDPEGSRLEGRDP